MYLNFLCRASKKLKNGLNPLELSIILGQERKILTLDRQIKAQDFNAKRQRVRRDEETNLYMDAVKTKLYSIESEMLRRNMPMNIKLLLDIYTNGFDDAKLTVLTLFDRHNQEAKQKADKELIVKATYNKYLLTRRYLADFLQIKWEKPDILIKDITPTFIEQFFVYLCSFMDRNTAIHKMKLLKKILRIAKDEGYIQSMPFKLKLINESLEYNPLTIEEIRKLRRKKFSTARLEQVRDMFVFACYTGLAFTDLCHLTRNDMITDETGKEWIIKSRQKTNVVSYIPLLPIAKEIWLRYDYQLPMVSNQKYNAYLKEIADLCGINKKLHSHLARHTCATILLNNGVDIVSVSKILGHSNSKITEKIYAQMLPETIMQRVTEVADKII